MLIGIILWNRARAPPPRGRAQADTGPGVPRQRSPPAGHSTVPWAESQREEHVAKGAKSWVGTVAGVTESEMSIVRSMRSRQETQESRPVNGAVWCSAVPVQCRGPAGRSRHACGAGAFSTVQFFSSQTQLHGYRGRLQWRIRFNRVEVSPKSATK